MDAHFAEYLAVIHAVHETYGEQPESLPSDFHEAAEQAAPATVVHEYLGV